MSNSIYYYYHYLLLLLLPLSTTTINKYLYNVTFQKKLVYVLLFSNRISIEEEEEERVIAVTLPIFELQQCCLHQKLGFSSPE